MTLWFWRHRPYRGEDLGLRDDAVGEAVLSAFRRDLGPRDLEACDALVRLRSSHSPEEVACDVPLMDGEGCSQVLRLGQNFGMP